MSSTVWQILSSTCCGKPQAMTHSGLPKLVIRDGSSTSSGVTPVFLEMTQDWKGGWYCRR